MRALVISDIHANITALEAVLEDAGTIDAVWCLGDVVGYGPSPNDCIALLKQQPNLTCILGNHDAAALNMLELDSFNPEARTSVEWMQTQLSSDSLYFLHELPETAIIDQVTLSHGSPRYPVFEYLLDTRSATENFEYFDTDFCFVGHSHLPVAFTYQKNEYMASLSVPPVNQSIGLKPRTIVNPGSVGQPRDRDPRAAYAIFESETAQWKHQRVEYDIKKVQKLMREANLPQRHIIRLAEGW
jgi:predicted phosphodiesterase